MRLANPSRLLFVLTILAAQSVGAAEVGHYSTIARLMPYAGDKIQFGFTAPSPQCLNPDNYFTLEQGQLNGNADEKAALFKTLYALALSAMLSDKPIFVYYDDSSGSCYIKRFALTYS